MISEGIRSGVNWILLKFNSRVLAKALMRLVLASPLGPSKRQCPPVKQAMIIVSKTSSRPTITRRNWETILSRDVFKSSKTPAVLLVMRANRSEEPCFQVFPRPFHCLSLTAIICRRIVREVANEKSDQPSSIDKKGMVEKDYFFWHCIEITRRVKITHRMHKEV